MNFFFLVAGAADLTGVVVHGILGHRIVLTPLTRDRLFATRAFGDEDMTRRIFAVSWHVVTAAFGSSAVAFLLLATGRLQGTALPLVLSAMHATFLAVGLSLVGRRAAAAFRRPIPITFATCMTTACVSGWMGTR